MVRLSKLETVRKRKLLSQAELAAKAGISKNSVHRLETGTSLAQGRTVRKIAEALGVDPGELFEQPNA
jgi:transcriptional regulator with XRE-family HTH domain